VRVRLGPFSCCTAYDSCTIHKLKESDERRINYGHYSNILSETKQNCCTKQDQTIEVTGPLALYWVRKEWSNYELHNSAAHTWTASSKPTVWTKCPLDHSLWTNTHISLHLNYLNQTYKNFLAKCSQQKHEPETEVWHIYLTSVSNRRPYLCFGFKFGCFF
jgi:hypothetical protein